MRLDIRDLDVIVRKNPAVEAECFEWAYNAGFLSGAKSQAMLDFESLKNARNRDWAIVLNGIINYYNAKYSMPLRDLHDEITNPLHAEAKEECFKVVWTSGCLPSDEALARAQFDSALPNYYAAEKYLSVFKHNRELNQQRKADFKSGLKKWGVFAAVSLPTAILGYFFYDSVKNALDSVPVLGKAWSDLGWSIPAGLLGLEAYVCLRSPEGKQEDMRALNESKKVDPVENMNFKHLDDLFSKM